MSTMNVMALRKSLIMTLSCHHSLGRLLTITLYLNTDNMDRIKDLQRKVKHLLEYLAEYTDNCGNIVLKENNGQLLNHILTIQDGLNELEKIQNYNNASDDSKQETPSKDMVNHPSHYKGAKFECIDIMLDIFGKEKVSAFCELNAFKYQWRSHAKGTDIQDKEKAVWYLNKYITLKENSQVNNEL